MGDNPLEGIIAQASFSDAAARGDSAATGVIISGAVVVQDPTDSLGYFELFLKRTGTYPDTSKAFYDIRGYQDDVLMFEILQVYVPGSGNVDLGNILGAREP